MNETKLDVSRITELQNERTQRWHDEPSSITEKNFYALVEDNHRNNFELWHTEDKARRDDKGFEYVYRAKRQIDNYNQQRNNAMEKMDQWIFENYQPNANNDCPCHSETPGMIIDRLSILALKEYHMRLQTNRKEVSTDHLAQCEQKLTVIKMQLQQLQTCLSEFLDEIIAGKRTFRVYYQCKMYNDPKLNPQLYKNEKSHSQTTGETA